MMMDLLILHRMVNHADRLFIELKTKRLMALMFPFMMLRFAQGEVVGVGSGAEELPIGTAISDAMVELAGAPRSIGFNGKNTILG